MATEILAISTFLMSSSLGECGSSDERFRSSSSSIKLSSNSALEFEDTTFEEEDTSYPSVNIEFHPRDPKKRFALFSRRCFAVCCFTSFIFSIIIFTCGSVVGVVFILFETKIISFRTIPEDSIVVPEGMGIYDLNIFTFHKGSLYSLDSSILLLNEEEEFKTKYYEKEEESELIKAIPFDDKKKVFDCDGICDCYLDENEWRRSVGTLVYSSRFSKTVVASVIGWAFATLVSETIEECYDEAREVYGNSERLTCSFRAKGEISEESCTERKMTAQASGKDFEYSCAGRCRLAKTGPLSPKEYDLIDAYYCNTAEVKGSVFAPVEHVAIKKFEIQKLPDLCANVFGLSEGVKCAPSNTKYCVEVVSS